MTFKQKVKIFLFLLNAITGFLAAIFVCIYIARSSQFQNTSESSSYADKLLTASYYAILILLVIVYLSLAFIGSLCVFFHCKMSNKKYFLWTQIAFGILMVGNVALIFSKIQNSTDIITSYAYNQYNSCPIIKLIFSYSGLSSTSKDALDKTDSGKKLVHWVKAWLATRVLDFGCLLISIFSGTSFLWLLLLENKSELMTSGINDPIMN